MTETKAIFLSYASQDVPEAQRICDALRAAGLVVWFDQSELRGGDAWDATIRKQIKECALFVPMISANTNARNEGYFRLEWKLAVDRSHLMADDMPFLLPVMIDATIESTARVPDRFRERQWSQLPAGEVSTEFIERVKRLLFDEKDQVFPTSVEATKQQQSPIASPSHATVGKISQSDSLIVSRPNSNTDMVAVGAATRDLSIVVLPFANRTGDPQQEYIADGITESLTMDFSRFQDVLIVSSTTAFSFKGRQLTTRQVGQELGVRFVVQGSVQRSGDKLRISVQLGDCATNAQLWSDAFEGNVTELFALQDQVASRVANSIGREIILVAATVNEGRIESPQVSDLLLRARGMRQKPMSLANQQQIESLNRQALALEPNHVQAMTGLASSLSLQAANFGSELEADAREGKFAEARELALKAKERDPENPINYFILGIYAATHNDFGGFRRAAEKFLALQPKNPGAYNNLAMSFLLGAEPKKALELLAKSIDLGPRNPYSGTLLNMGRAHFMLGDYDSAIEWCQKSLQASSQQTDALAYLAMAFAESGDCEAARAAAVEFCQSSPKANLGNTIDAPLLTGPEAYRTWFDSKLLPAWRKAGLPE